MIRKRKKYLFIFGVVLLIVGIYILKQKKDPILIALHLKEPPKKEVIVYKPERTIKIIEGWTTRDIAQYLENKGIVQRDEFLEIVGFPGVNYKYNKDLPKPKDFSKEFDFLKDKPKNVGLEGYLFPDTYRIFTDSNAKDIVVKMLDNFGKKLSPNLRKEIKRQGKSIYEIVIMASIIEKEAPVKADDDRDARIISGIFWNRLKNGQGLQSDATLSYILNDKEEQHKGKDLELNSLYNTYKYRGLPPGPICNPSLAAIKAAVYPIDTDYNYFLTPKNSNKVIYAKTYKEHLRNKYKYLR